MVVELYTARSVRDAKLSNFIHFYIACWLSTHRLATPVRSTYFWFVRSKNKRLSKGKKGKGKKM